MIKTFLVSRCFRKNNFTFLVKFMTEKSSRAHLYYILPKYNEAYSGIPKKDQSLNWYLFTELYVTPKMRQKGVATALFEDIVEWADQNKSNIILVCEPSASSSISKRELSSFYRKFGFKRSKKYFDAMLRYSN